MADAPSKSRWESENVIMVNIKINRNQDPDLYALLAQAESKSAAARDLMRQALER